MHLRLVKGQAPDNGDPLRLHELNAKQLEWFRAGRSLIRPGRPTRETWQMVEQFSFEHVKGLINDLAPAAATDIIIQAEFNLLSGEAEPVLRRIACLLLSKKPG